MAERALPWIPPPQSSRAERSTSAHNDDSKPGLSPLYSHVLTSHNTVKVSTDCEDGREVLSNKRTVPPQSHTESPLINLKTTSPLNGHESPTDISGRNYECDELVPQQCMPIYSESVGIQEYRSKYVDLLKKERSEHEVVLER